MRILALDVGDRRIGLAISDATGMLATPLHIIENYEQVAACREIDAVARDKEAQKIIVGLPLSMSGEDSAQTAKTRIFADNLAAMVKVPVVFCDERLSTVTAANLHSEVKTRRGKVKQRLDAMAAAVILQSYLDGEVSELPR
jgi:putative pre-16S rRNA nuclease